MSATLKRAEGYNSLAEQVIKYVQKSGYQDVKADFEGYDTPGALTMVNQGISLTPDFTATKNDKKFYFELVFKNTDEVEQSTMISKWKALESISKIRGGSLGLFVPHGCFKYATSLLQENNIEARVIKMSDI